MHVRAPRPSGQARIEIYAGEVGQWSRECAALQVGWTPVEATLRYDWTDAEAAAAGWKRGPSAFSWSDTVTHVGKIVISRSGEMLDTLDVDEFSVSGK